MNNDFEVLPPGSLNELVFLRKKMSELLEAGNNQDSQLYIRNIIEEIRSFYRQVV